MKTKLPQILETYYDAKNRHDIDAMTKCFAANATVHDEGEELIGTAAIKDWITRTTEQYRVQVEVTDVEEKDGGVITTALVSGNFDGSPIEMRFYFTLEKNKIASLKIV